MTPYAYECPAGHESTLRAPMGEAPAQHVCACGLFAHRVYVMQFQEDRTRFFRNPVDGTKFSYSLGCAMPDNRAAYHALLREKGCEPVTRATMPAEWKREQEYAAHVKHGGQRDKNFEAPPPKKAGISVLEQLRKSNVRIPS